MSYWVPTAKNYVTNVGLVINRYAIASSVVNKVKLPRSNFNLYLPYFAYLKRRSEQETQTGTHYLELHREERKCVQSN